MKVYKCNIWDFIGSVDVICITTNGFIKSNGHGVMGAGIALEANNRFPNICKTLGNHLTNYGNTPGYLSKGDRTEIYSFPTKRDVYDRIIEDPLKFPGFANSKIEYRFKENKVIPGWALKSELWLIKQSAEIIMNYANTGNWKSVLLPKPGCNNGGLLWSEVEPILDNILDRRFFIVTKRGD